ncbi:uncharacterized protein MONOS_17901 [Monocercomonoides exilis]|uniref:uncharacterized protein n=1 Tax=Monocercomonoides exilis TaxID=2049356 RepID=UPI00355ABF2F|nr:hypothetical protein MONOS_17901 [Monocercomonoides exilis]
MLSPEEAASSEKSDVSNTVNIFASVTSPVELFKELAIRIQDLLTEASESIQEIEDQFNEIQNEVDAKKFEQNKLNERLMQEKARFEKEITSFLSSLSGFGLPHIAKNGE